MSLISQILGMLFNSFEFIFLFLPLTLVLYFVLNHFSLDKVAKAWLVLASLYFYSYFNQSYLLIIISSILVNYYIGHLLHQERYATKVRNWILGIGLAFNIGLLGYFKYRDFFIENVNAVFQTNIPLLSILLPLGISFFTFQQLSFVVDSYRRTSLKYDFLSYCLFVTFFPQLIAGPIVLPTEMLPQFEDRQNKRVNFENLNRGLFLFCIGFAKKVLIADTISCYANTGFDHASTLSFAEAWLTSLSYTMQLYFDFSGYCDMAMGIGLMFNIKLPLNFNSPYKAVNFQDFWKRWHMTLGRFLSNYLYIPLGGNRKGRCRTLINLLIVFLVSGIWHGAGWGFILWGALHGAGILIHRVWKDFGLRMPALLGWAITFFFVNVFWVFFRAETIQTAWNVLSAMFDIGQLSFYLSPVFLNESNQLSHFTTIPNLCLFFVAVLIAFFAKNSLTRTMENKLNSLTILEQSFYFCLSLIFISKTADFLYWNF